MIDSVEKSLFEALREVVMRATGVSECILADQNAAAPQGDYATIRISDNMSENIRPQESYSESADSNSDLLEFSLKTSLISSVHINFYRDGALSKAAMLVGCTRIPSISNIITRAKLGIMRFGSVINTTALQSDRTEERATIKIEVAYERLYTEEIAPIKSVGFTVTDDRGNTITGDSA